VSPRKVEPDPRDPLFPGPRPRLSLRQALARPTGHRGMDGLLGTVLGLMMLGWGWAVVQAVAQDERLGAAGPLTANPFSPASPPEAAFVLDALVRAFSGVENLRGESREVAVLIHDPGEPIALPLPDDLEAGVRLEYHPVRNGQLVLDAPGLPADTDGVLRAPGEPGVWGLVAELGGVVREIEDVRVITQVPLTRRQAGRIGGYLIGEWPFERGGRPPSDAYRPPSGIIEVTPENVDLPISEHFTLGDFLTKGQADVWPKYVLVSPRLLDKLELTIQELQRRGYPVENVGVISGFRTPTYNTHGGDPSGRGALSRHMYGDAMDFFIDNDRDGRMDDLNGDGRVTVADARIIAEAAEAVERAHPSLIGGIGVYTPTGAHSGFVHLDTRGYRARW